MGSEKKGGIDISLILYFAFWFWGNAMYNLQNKRALKAAGGSEGFPMTVSTLQLGVGVIYALFLWVAPDARAMPKKFTMTHFFKMIPVAFCSAAAHSLSVFALSAGAVSFGQIVKSGEPVFNATIGYTMYGKRITLVKSLSLIVVVGGVCLASVNELDFAMAALVSASLANAFASVKGQENKKIMDGEMKSDLGSTGNQFAITKIMAFLISLPVMWYMEGHKFDQFVGLLKTDTVLRNNLILSGLTFYGYNELSTMCLKKVSPVSNSVANTAKRVLVIVSSAIVLGEDLPFMKMVGCATAIGGVFIYSILPDATAVSASKKDK